MYKIIEENDIWALEPHTYLSPGSVIISCKRLFWLGANELTCPVPRALISNCSHKIDNCKHMVLHIAGMHKAHEQRTLHALTSSSSLTSDGMDQLPCPSALLFIL